MQITIGSPVVPVTLANVYELKIELMSGDADAYSTEKFMFKADEVEDMRELNEALEVLQYLVDAERGGYVDKERRTLQKRLAAQFPTFDHDMINDVVLHRDTTDNSYSFYAAVEDFTLFYYNEAGVKHTCHIAKDPS